MSPTGIPSASSRTNGLSELTDAAQNTRGAMGPPFNGSIKHKPTGRKLLPLHRYSTEAHTNSSRARLQEENTCGPCRRTVRLQAGRAANHSLYQPHREERR